MYRIPRACGSRHRNGPVGPGHNADSLGDYSIDSTNDSNLQSNTSIDSSNGNSTVLASSSSSTLHNSSSSSGDSASASSTSQNSTGSGNSSSGGIISVIDIESDFMVESSQDSAVSSSSPSSTSSYDGNSISNDSIQEQRRNDNHRYGISIERQMLLTNEDILLFGLTYSGFGEERQNVRNSLNVDRFKAHFGPEPRTVKDILLDLKAEFSGDVVYKDVMMAMNWLKLYEIEHVMAGRWKYGEDFIRDAVKVNTKKLASLRSKVVKFDGFDENEIHLCTVDGFNTITQEFRLNPSTAYFNHKDNGPGLKYEFGLALRRSLLVWMKGPIPAGSMHDRTVFCGGTKDQPKSLWDKTALYFQLPKGKKAIGDSAYSGLPDKALVSLDGHSKKVRDFINRAKARQESYHWRLKTYEVLRAAFRHGTSTEDKISLHGTCTEAVVVIVQYDLKYHPVMQLTGKAKEKCD